MAEKIKLHNHSKPLNMVKPVVSRSEEGCSFSPDGGTTTAKYGPKIMKKKDSCETISRVK